MAPPSLVTLQGPGFAGALTAAITLSVTPLAGIPQSRSLAGRTATCSMVTLLPGRANRNCHLRGKEDRDSAPGVTGDTGGMGRGQENLRPR